MAKHAHFGPAFFGFLAELARNNERDWFQANKGRYATEVEGPFLAFLAELEPRLSKISRHFVVDPRRTGGSMFRIYRDTRFSADKTPYKTHVAAQFSHEARSKDRSVPGFYLHLAPDESLGGGGLYHPEPGALGQVRDRIAGKPKEWEAVLKGGLPIQGDTLKRPPAGFDPAHRFVDALKRKDHYTMVGFTAKEVQAPGFLDRYVDSCAEVAPLMKFLARALELPY